MSKNELIFINGTRISFLHFVVNMHVLLGRKCIRHLRSLIDPVISVSDIYAKISAFEIKIGTLNAPLILHLQIMVMNDIQGELVPTITQILVRMVI